jgi:hypothetical protein
MDTLLDGLPILILVALTSTGAFWFGVKGLSLPAHRLRAAFRGVLETFGLMVVFLMLNVIVGAAIILSVRSFTSGFLSVYFVSDDRLFMLAPIQGLAFQYWRSSADSGV